jgi:hypothetical protein
VGPHRGTSDGRDDGLSEPVEATVEEFEKVEVSEDLELLADFVVDVEGILRRNTRGNFHEDGC